MVSSSQIRNELAFALAGVVPLDDFEDWFVKNTWNIRNAGSIAAEVLTFAIEESLSEYSSGHISEDKLRKELARILQSETQHAEIVDTNIPIWLERPYSFRSSASSVLVPDLARP